MNIGLIVVLVALALVGLYLVLGRKKAAAAPVVPQPAPQPVPALEPVPAPPTAPPAYIPPPPAPPPTPVPAPSPPPPAPAPTPAPAPAADPNAFTPEQFGAKGDGTTNDSAALYKLGAAVTVAGGGTIEFRQATYLVGGQFNDATPDALYSWSPAALLEIAGCSKPLVIRGNGARLLCADGLRFGTFTAAGDKLDHPMPYTGPGVASPYKAMIRVSKCTAPVEVSGFEMDGNLPKLVIGGPYGDTGYQIPATGLVLTENLSDEAVSDVYAHHHAQDGILIDGDDRVLDPAPKRLLSNVRSEYNGRQGCSIVAGRGYAFEKCRFAHTGRSVIGSAPGAGIDIEAEVKTNRDFTFTDCEFVDNLGCGMVADSGDSEGAVFTRCTFIGTIAWSCWAFKPRFEFRGCSFVGAMVRAHGDAVDPSRAAQFLDCTFSDDPKLSPTGEVYLGGKDTYAIADLSSEVNVHFARCTFDLTGGGLLPWSWYGIYEDCTMSQKATAQAYPKGKYLGASTLTCPPNGVDLYGTNVIGTLTVNGQKYENQQLGGTSW